MKMKKMCKVISLGLLLCMLFQTCVLGVSAEGNVKVTGSEYEVYYTGIYNTFLYNKKSIGSEPGTEYYLTYTVESSKECGIKNGILGTTDSQMMPSFQEPKGIMYYEQQEPETKNENLFMEGYTYFIQYVVTEDGFRYKAARAKGDKAEYFTLNEEKNDFTAGEKKFKLDRFGIWLDAGVSNIHLTHVRFYDKNGNDLGLASKDGMLAIVQNSYRAKNKTVDHHYTIEANDLSNIAISNAKPLLTNKMYIEYTVKSSDSKCNQNGIICSNQPKQGMPHTKGFLRLFDDQSLLQVGADYLITLEKKNDNFTALIQITKNGKTTYAAFPALFGEYSKDYQYFSLWFGEQLNHSTFVLENVKFYDANGNHLGVQSNNKELDIDHFGELEDYAGCEAVYYCKENASYYALFANQELYFTNNMQTVKGTYSVKNNVITITKDDQTEDLAYMFQHITDSDGNQYRRLYTYKVKFVTGTNVEIETQTLNTTTGYTAQIPDEPVMEDCTFVSWCTADGKEFDFNSIVSESKTLYAKWTDDAGVVYMALDSGKLQAQRDFNTYAVIGVSALVAVLTIVCGAFMIRGGVRYGSNSKKKEKNR